MVIAHDWRSPICSMYYDYNIGRRRVCLIILEKKEKGKITKKRQIIIKDGVLKDVDEQDTLSNDSVLLKYLQGKFRCKIKVNYCYNTKRTK